MADSPTWEVDLYVSGPVTIREPLLTTQQKGFRVDDPFYSDVQIRAVPTGLRATVTARADAADLAFKAAHFFFGGMLDALTLVVNEPMSLSFADPERPPSRRHEVRRIIAAHEFIGAFHEAHLLETGSPSFLRGLGWYQKGLNAPDPFDRFLAFWNAIETVAGKYYCCIPTIDQARASQGSKSQIWECFKALWGECDKWPLVAGDNKWIDESCQTRNKIAHGAEPVDIHRISDVSARVGTVGQMAYAFLRDWRKRMPIQFHAVAA